MLNPNPIQFGIFNKLLSVDKSLIPYFGQQSAKIYINPLTARPFCVNYHKRREFTQFTIFQNLQKPYEKCKHESAIQICGVLF